MDSECPSKLGTLHIDKALDLISEEAKLSKQWPRGQLAITVTNWSVPLLMMIKFFQLDTVEGKVKIN